MDEFKSIGVFNNFKKTNCSFFNTIKHSELRDFYLIQRALGLFCISSNIDKDDIKRARELFEHTKYIQGRLKLCNV